MFKIGETVFYRKSNDRVYKAKIVGSFINESRLFGVGHKFIIEFKADAYSYDGDTILKEDDLHRKAVNPSDLIPIK